MSVANLCSDRTVSAIGGLNGNNVGVLVLRIVFEGSPAGNPIDGLGLGNHSLPLNGLGICFDSNLTFSKSIDSRWQASIAIFQNTNTTRTIHYINVLINSGPFDDDVFEINNLVFVLNFLHQISGFTVVEFT